MIMSILNKSYFFINNNKWLIEEKTGKEILDVYKERTGNNNAYMCNGLTFYKEHKIWIDKELCDDEKRRTLNVGDSLVFLKRHNDDEEIYYITP